MPLPDQQPSEEFAERFGETGAGLLTIPHLVAVDNSRRMQAAARRRVDEAHEMHKRALGMSDIGKTEDGAAVSDDMGDIIYTGDITLNPGQQVQLGKNTVFKAEQTPPIATSATATTAASPTAAPSTSNRWLPLILAAAVVGSGGLGYWLANKTPVQPAASVDTDTITEMDFPTK